MGFRIANNIASMNVQRQLTVSDNNLTKSLERLSSGFRINSAADDAAGLALSQTMRADIASFKVASRNATEANSLLQTAEGAMDQIGNMLVRLKELATQAASANTGTNRAQIDEEKTKLTAEIERIASVTAYSGSTLLDGTFGSISGTLAGGTATNTNQYGVNSDMSQMFTYTNSANTLYTPTMGAIASGQTNAYCMDGSTNNYYHFTEGTIANTITLAVSSQELVEGTYSFVQDTTTIALTNSGGATLAYGSVAANVATFDFGGQGTITISATALDTAALDGASLKYYETGLGAASLDGSVDVSDITTLTITTNTANTLTVNDGSDDHTGVIANGVATFSDLGLKISLDTDEYAAADVLSGLQYTLSGGVATDTPTVTFTVSKTSIAAGTYTIDRVSANTVSIGNGSVTEYAAAASNTVNFSGLGIQLTASSTMTGALLGNDSLVVANTGITALTTTDSTTTGTYTITDTAGSITVTHSGGSTQTESGSAGNVIDFDQLGIKITLGSDYVAGALDNLAVSVSQSSSKTFQLGTENTADNQIAISLTDVTLSGLGLSSIDLSTAAGALAALTTVDTAISTHSTARGSIGAFMNRLSYASANLATTVQNMQAAESVIRDADMASEMTEFTKAQILMQAGTAMLTQANMAPQMVLSLFG